MLSTKPFTAKLKTTLIRLLIFLKEIQSWLVTPECKILCIKSLSQLKTQSKISWMSRRRKKWWWPIADNQMYWTTTPDLVVQLSSSLKRWVHPCTDSQVRGMISLILNSNWEGQLVKYQVSLECLKLKKKQSATVPIPKWQAIWLKRVYKKWEKSFRIWSTTKKL